MKKCCRCGAENPDEKKWCSKCMKPLVDADRFEDSRREKVEMAESPRKRDDIPSKLRGKMGGNHFVADDTISERSPRKIEHRDFGMNCCLVCGKANHKEAKYCRYCGAKRRKNADKGTLFRICVTAVCMVIALLACIIPMFSGNRNRLEYQYPQNEQKVESAVRIENTAEAISELKKSADEYGYENALSELTEKSTNTIDGDSYYRLQQNYKGIPVYGKTVVYVTDENGKTQTVTGNVVDIDEKIDLSPSVTAELVESAVRKYIQEYYGEDIGDLGIIELGQENLCVYTGNDSGDASLAYCINIGWKEYVVSASTGQVMYVHDTVDDLTGYIHSDTERNNGFPIVQNGEGEYELYDEGRGICVRDLGGESSKDKENLEACPVISSPDIIFGNGDGENEYEKAARMQINTASACDYFFKVCNYSSPSIFVFINDGFEFGCNASGGKYGTSQGKYVGLLTVGSVTGIDDVDVIGHEFCHLMSRDIVDWTGYSLENKAINEAYSDIFGELYEMDYHKWENPDWLLSSDNHIWVRRNLAEPHQTFNAEKVGDSLLMATENDKYFQSTVISHAAYLMWNGIDGTTAKKISTDDLAKLWYRAMLMMPSDCDFYTCRKLVELAANAMELTTEQIACVSEAFDRVGIISDEKEEKTDYTINPDSKLYIYGGDGELYDNYTLRISEKKWFGELQKLLVVSVSKAEAYKLDLDKGTYVFTITDEANQSEIKTITVAVKDKSDNRKIEIYTYFGGTPVKGTVAEISTVDGVKKNIPIEKAVVTIRSQTQNQTVETIRMQDKNGVFETCLPAGNYDITVEADGYVTSTQSFTVTTEDAVYLDFELRRVGVEKQLTKVIHYDENGDLYREYNFSYNNKKQLSEIETSYTSIGGKSVKTYSYDSAGRLTKEMTEGIPYETAQYWYDEDGRLVKWMWAEGGAVYHYISYDDDGRIIKEECSMDGADEITEYIYKSGVLEKTISTRTGYTGSDLKTVDWTRVTETTYEFDSEGRIVKTENLVHDNLMHDKDETFMIQYLYDYKPFVVSNRKGYLSGYLDINLMAGNGNQIWKIYVAEGVCITDKDGYLARVEGGDETYVFLYDGEEPAYTPESLYIPVVESIWEDNIKSDSEDVTDYHASRSSGVLFDMDNDGVKEMILCYPLTDYWTTLAYGIYDIEQGKVVTVAEDVTFGVADVAGCRGGVGVVLYQEKPTFVTFARYSETSKSSTAKYYGASMKIAVYSYNDLALLKTLEVETTANSISYYIDEKTVSEQEFQKEMEKFTYLEIAFDSGWISSYSTIDHHMKLDELLKYLKMPVAME